MNPTKNAPPEKVSDCEQCDVLRDELKDLDSDLDDANDRIRQLEQERDDLQMAMEDLEDERDDLLAAAIHEVAD